MHSFYIFSNNDYNEKYQYPVGLIKGNMVNVPYDTNGEFFFIAT